jgi:predicted  nucleic acid-binding Zn-ribbon protein
LNEKQAAINSVSALTREIEYLRRQSDDDRRNLESLETKKEKFSSNLDVLDKKINAMEDAKK